MITGDLKNQIDKLWLEFWQGGISNPLTVIEQVTFLMFTRLLDINETRDEKRSKRAGQDFKPRFGADQQHLRWSDFIHIEDAEKLHTLVRDQVFKHIREHTSDSRFGDYMKDARLVIDKPSLLQKAVRMIDKLPLESSDTKGDLYEYLLSKLSTAGINGQFRTPRHIIKLMVRMLDPKPNELVADPACGTAGFLVSVLEYLLETYTSEDGVIRETITLDNGKTEEQCIYSGDLLDQEQWDHIIVDPPSMGHSEDHVERAKTKYIELFSTVAKKSKASGQLSLSSCSSHISFVDFLEIITEALSIAKRRGQILRVSGQGPDHPFPHSCTELQYLKFVHLILN